MPTVPPSAVPGQAIEDLGGPTPENYRADDDSAKLREPRLSHVSNVVNAKAAKADPMPTLGKEASYEETEDPEEETITEEEVTETPEYSVEEDMDPLCSLVKNSPKSSRESLRRFLKKLSTPKLLRLLRTWRRRTKSASWKKSKLSSRIWSSV